MIEIDQEEDDDLNGISVIKPCTDENSDSNSESDSDEEDDNINDDITVEDVTEEDKDDDDVITDSGVAHPDVLGMGMMQKKQPGNYTPTFRMPEQKRRRYRTSIIIQSGQQQ